MFYVCVWLAQRKHRTGSGSGRQSEKMQCLLLCLLVLDKWIILLSGWLRLNVNIIQEDPKGMQYRGCCCSFLHLMLLNELTVCKIKLRKSEGQ